jgi:hypothetical protein
MTEEKNTLAFFKALADGNRLKIVGLLIKQPYTVEQLSSILGLGASTVSHHLSKLSDAGLVSATARSYYNFYQLDTDRFKEMGRLIQTLEAFPIAGDLDENAHERKLLNNFLLPNGRLKTIPAQRKKLLVILNFILSDFKSGKRYTEKEVNTILSKYHEDTASLRREMIGAGLMARENSGGEYWRTDQTTTAE